VVAGVRDGVRRGSDYHRTEYFGPILGILTAATLDEAVDIVNEVDYGLTSGLHSLDPAELRTWLARVEAGNLYVNRGITGAIVRRQPFGGWKRSAVGAGTKAGGLNYLVGLGSWVSAPAAAGAAPVEPSVVRLQRAVADVLDDTARESLARALASDELAWRERFGEAIDVSGIWAERNVARYLPFPTPVVVRAGADATVGSLVRVVAAGARAGAPMRVSVAPSDPQHGRTSAVPDVVLDALRDVPGVTAVSMETPSEFGDRAATANWDRVRLVGADASAVADLCAATNGRPDLAVFGAPVTEAGQVELLPFLREQSVSITAHRFGTPNHLSDGLL
jgi:RHH-type proline utilization regulon transcriptional repressor/proline dehydrogenase/delta 1-pyrroline-5-carboxylate dehydrogenase